jgi:hypothetical protein
VTKSQIDFFTPSGEGRVGVMFSMSFLQWLGSLYFIRKNKVFPMRFKSLLGIWSHQKLHIQPFPGLALAVSNPNFAVL